MFINFIGIVKLKRFLTSLIAGASLFTFGNTNPVLAGSCENAPDTGTVFKETGPGTWKIMTTVRQGLTSVNERKVAYAYKRLDLVAQRELSRWVETNVKNASALSEEAKAAFVVGPDDEVTDDSLEVFEEFAETFSSSTEALLVGIQNLGQCHTLGEEVRLSIGINSENAVAARNMKNQNSGGSSASTTSDTNATSASNTTSNDSIPSKPTTYRKDLNKGYSGYGNLDNF